MLLDKQAGEIFAINDDITERVHKLGDTTVRSSSVLGQVMTQG